MEPASTSTGVAFVPPSVGFMALLIGFFGQVGADVMMVVLASFIGCVISLSSSNKNTVFDALKYITIGVVTSLILAWALKGLIISWVPALDSPYLPSLIAMMIGFSSNRLPQIFEATTNKFESKIEG